jgi:hypothetical protein
MRKPRNYRLALLTAASMASAVLSQACTGSVRLYDANFNDYHQWDDREDRAYRSYLLQQHQDYRAIGQLDAGEQHEYWTWRHAHEDGGN